MKSVAIALLAAALLAGCSGSSASTNPPADVGKTASPNAGATASSSPAPLPNFNGNFGNNRFAAVAALRLARILFAQQQYWEVYVRTTPATLDGTYDPLNAGSFDAAARQATAIDLVLATEATTAIQLYGGGGVVHEKTELTSVGSMLAAMFPNARTVNMKVFYGEASLHATAVYSGGALDYRTGFK